MPPKRRRSAGTRRSRMRAVVPSLSDFSSNAADSRRPESATGRAGRRAIALALVALVGAVAPLLLASGAAATPLTDGAIAGPPTDGGTAASVPTAASATQQTGSALNESEKREAAREGVSRGVELAQLQGVDVTQAQVQAARDGAGMAANQSQTANVSQIQAAVAGATHAALVQSQNVSVEQFQAAVGGATSGSLTQTQNVSVTQLQSASFGAVHGALAEKRRGGARDVRAACEGAAAGAASSGVTAVPVVQEAAQGSAYGAITQRQNVSVEQRQAAAFGAARGVLESGQNVSVAQRQSVDVKKVQTAALGAAKGALTQSQQATVEQVQAAGRGAAKGAIAQYQRVTVEQIQAAAAGAASGGISQYQSASVTQIQAAATGGARGALVRSQSVNVVQIQKAASGSASGAARGAAQSQVVDIEQIQAAATGAAEGGIVQIQVVNIVQIQIVTDSAAEGAVSQSQVANVVQIQNAARGASRGGVGLTQIQTVSITQLQISVTQSASTAAESAANEGVTDGDEISDSAQGDVEDEYVPPSPDVESLEVAVDCESLSVENPNDVAVTVTRVAENGSVDNVTVPAGETRAISVSAMSYALRAETEDGTFVRVDGLVTFVVDVDPCPPPASESLDVTVEGRNVTVENPNDVAVNLTVENASGGVFEGSVPADGNETIPGLEPGDYDLSAERDGEVVLVEGEEVYTVTIQAEDDDDDGDGPDDGDGVDTELSSCTVVDEPGRYTLTGDVSAEVSESGACIEIQSSDVALDGQGYALALTEGGNASGVAVEGSETLSNVTVANLTVEGFNVGVEVRDAEDGAVRNVTVAGTPPEDGQTGIDLSMVSEFVVADSSVQGSADVRTTGIDATQSGDLTISGNDVTPAGGSGTGISFTIVGDSEVTDNDVSDGDTGIQVFNTGGNRVANNTVTEFDVGIYVSEAQDNDFADNRIENSSHGVLINGVSDENSFTDTQVANADTGFDVVDSADIVVEGATIDGADTAVSLTGEGYLGDDPTDYPSGVRLVDVEVTDAVTAIYADNGSTAVAEGLAIGPVAGIALDATNVSVAGSRGVTGEVPGTGALPAFPEGVTPVVDAGNESAPFVGITGTDEDPSVELELPYDDTALPEEVNESALRLWRSNGTTDGAWTLVAGSTVDAGGNLVSGEFAPESGVERAYGPAARTEAEPVAFENLSVAVEGRNVTVENPNDVAVNLTVANESRAVANASVSAGGNATIGPLAPGNYTLTATADGRTVPVEGEDRYAFAIEAPEPGPELDSIQVETDVCAVPVADGGATRQLSVNVTNSNDQDVALVAFFEGEERAVVTVPAGNQTVDLPPEAGNWTFRAYVPADAAEETEFDEPGPYPNLTAVPVNDAESVPVTVELCAIDIGVSQTDGNVTVTNDEPIDATVFVRNDTLQTVPVPAGESVALDSLAPDEYTLTAEAIDGGPAMFDGETSLNVTIEAIGTPTPTPTPNETVTPTPNETVTPTESPTPTPTPTPTESPTQTPTTTATPTESPTDTQVATTAPTTPEPTPTEGPTPTDAPVTTPTETGTPTPTETPTPSPTATPAPTVAPTSTPTATSAPAGTQTTASQQFGVDTSGDSPGVVRATAEAATGLVESVGGLLERASDAIAGAIGSVTPTTDTLDAVVAERTVFGYETMTTWLP